MRFKTVNNNSWSGILLNALIAAFSLFINGFGVYLTIQANIGAGPWDVLNLGISKTLGILYGTASVAVSYLILALVVGKSVDFFNMIHAVPAASSLVSGIVMMFVGLIIIAFTQYTYMAASLGCGSRDTLLVGLAKRFHRIPIGTVSICLLSLATLTGWLLGGPVGVGTLICAFCAGPIMQVIFTMVRFDAAHVHHQNLKESLGVILH